MKNTCFPKYNQNKAVCTSNLRKKKDSNKENDA